MSPCGCWYPPFRADLWQCRCLRKDVLGSSLTLPSCLLRCGLATYSHNPVPRCFAEEPYQSPSVAFPACFLSFLLWDKKSFRSGCSHPGYTLGVDISKRSVSLFYSLCYDDCQVPGWVWDRNTKLEVCSCLKAQCCHPWQDRFDSCSAARLPEWILVQSSVLRKEGLIHSCTCST